MSVFSYSFHRLFQGSLFQRDLRHRVVSAVAEKSSLQKQAAGWNNDLSSRRHNDLNSTTENSSYAALTTRTRRHRLLPVCGLTFLPESRVGSTRTGHPFAWECRKFSVEVFPCLYFYGEILEAGGSLKGSCRFEISSRIMAA